MGNKLTVANATDNDICVRASVGDFDLKGATVGIGQAVSVGLTFEEQMVQLGSVAVSPSKTWTFPRVVFCRYFLTVTKKGYSDVIANVAQIPWQTNIIVTPDNKPATAKSGTVWIDDFDDTNYYAPKKNASPQLRSAELQSPPLTGFDGVDGVSEELDDAEVDGGTVTAPALVSPKEAAARLQLSADVPKFISSFIISHCFEHGYSNVDEIDENIAMLMKALASKMTSDHVERLKAARGDDIDEMLLNQLLQPLDLKPEVSQSVVGHLMAKEKRREKTASLLRQLAADAAAASSSSSSSSSSPVALPAAAAAAAAEDKMASGSTASADETNDDTSDSWMSRCVVL